jgi:asparagine synthase (glutamine-hydrolysing)
MCGITGFFSFRRQNRIAGETLRAMTRALAHRGPDDSGCLLINKRTNRLSFFSDGLNETCNEQGHVGLGHRRLSILDLSEKGRQPMSVADDKVWLAFNGEIYNYLELREELKRLGYQFKTDTDTEVVLCSYLQWGEDCFARFNGMWGLALYDARNDLLLLSRDRFGKKPLYYYIDDSQVLFASEIKSLFIHPAVPKEINRQKVIDYAGRHYRYVDTDNESYFKDILSVPKSSYIIFAGKGKKAVKEYWRLEPNDLSSKESSEGEIVEQFRTLLEDAVKIRLRSDVPVGSMLSGGLDSTSITAMAVKENKDFHSFSGVTGEGYFDESEYVDVLIRDTESKHTYVHPGPAQLFDILKEMLSCHDEPICTVTWYCNYLITRKIAQFGIPVILTGHGGDELLGGYWDHYHYNFSDLRSLKGDDDYEVSIWLENHKRPKEEYVNEYKYLDLLHRDKGVELRKYSQYLGCLSPKLLEYDRKKYLESSFKDDLSRRLYLELFHETIPPSLRAEDRNMMAFSIENRVPFLDYRLAEFCFQLNNSYKIRDGIGKWLLREAMKGILPEKIRGRKDKTGFNAPFDEWIRNDNKREIENLIEKKSYVNEEIYNKKKVREKFNEHLNGKNHYMFFWQFINLSVWYEQNFG